MKLTGFHRRNRNTANEVHPLKRFAKKYGLELFGLKTIIGVGLFTYFSNFPEIKTEYIERSRQTIEKTLIQQNPKITVATELIRESKQKSFGLDPSFIQFDVDVEQRENLEYSFRISNINVDDTSSVIRIIDSVTTVYRRLAYEKRSEFMTFLYNHLLRSTQRDTTESNTVIYNAEVNHLSSSNQSSPENTQVRITQASKSKHKPETITLVYIGEDHIERELHIPLYTIVMLFTVLAFKKYTPRLIRVGRQQMKAIAKEITKPKHATVMKTLHEILPFLSTQI